MQLLEMDPQAFQKTRALLSEGVQAGVAPAMAAGFFSLVDPDRGFYFTAGKAVSTTIFDLSSMTKVMATTALATVLVSRKFLNLDLPVQAYLADYPYKEIRIRHLLSHTSGLPWWKPYFETMGEIFEKEHPKKNPYQISIKVRQKLARRLVFETAPERAPDLQAIYSDVGFLVLGYVLEEITDLPLDEAVYRHVFRPMGLLDLSIKPFYRRTVLTPAHHFKEVAPTEECPWRKTMLQGQVHDDNCWMMGGYTGHAGLFGNLESVLFFAKKMLEGFFTPDVLAPFWTRVRTPVGCERTLGWDTPSDHSSMAGARFSKSTVGHWGFTGTGLWIDREKNIACTLLTNRVCPTRNNDLIKTFRPEFFDTMVEEVQRSLISR